MTYNTLPLPPSPDHTSPQATPLVQHPYPNPPRDLSPEELARRERVRAAARERQRKHRQVVKQRKMQELGVDMGSDMMPHHGMGPPPPDGGGGPPFHHILPPELHPHPGAPPPPPGFQQQQPSPQLSGGRLFASTILLSFSCDPLLKQHLMRTLHMTHDELASLEPVIADAWEHWDNQRRLHYEKHGADGGSSVIGSTSGGPNGPHPYSPPPPTNGDPSHEFRTRFRNSIEPFGSAYPANAQVDPAIQTPSGGASGQGPSSAGSIDPELAAQQPASTDSAKDRTKKTAAIDPKLEQGETET